MKTAYKLIICGAVAGAVNGLLGAGGGMLLIPLLSTLAGYSGKAQFSASVAIIMPLCIVSLLFSPAIKEIHIQQLLPYLAGSVLGGFAAGLWGKYIPAKWLHRALGLIILLGGFRLICKSL